MQDFTIESQVQALRLKLAGYHFAVIAAQGKEKAILLAKIENTKAALQSLGFQG